MHSDQWNWCGWANFCKHLFHLFLCKSEMNAGEFSSHHGSLIIVSNHFLFERHSNICMVKTAYLQILMQNMAYCKIKARDSQNL